MSEQNEQVPPAWLRPVLYVGLVVVAVLLIGPLAHFIQASASWLDYPYPRPGSEGLILYESLIVKHGGNLYSPITPAQFISGPYPPVYYWLAAWALPAGPPDFSNPAHVASIFRPGRIIALVSALATAALIPLLLLFEGGYYRKDKRTIVGVAAVGLVAGGVLLTLPQVQVWATRFRGDMLMIALSAAGLTAIAAGAPAGREPTGRLTPMLALGAVLFAMAFYTKQTALAGPIAAAAYLLLRDWRAGLKWCLAMFAAVLLPFLAIDFATENWFYLKMVVYHSLPYSRTTLTRLLHFAFWDNEWPLIIASLIYLLLVGIQAAGVLRPRRLWGLPLLVPLFVLASFLTLPTGGVVGADHNHLLMSGLAICAGSGAVLAGALAGRYMRPSLAPVSAIVTLLLLMGYVVFTSSPSPWYGPDLNVPTAPQQEQLRKITEYVRTTPGDPYFSDDPGIVALGGKQTPYDDPFTMTALAAQGRWDEATYRNMLREGKFTRLVLDCDVPGTLAQMEAAQKGQQIQVARPCRADTFTPGVLEAIRDGYNILFRDVRFTYIPKNLAP